tara:strand:+ start:1145 stop:1783 length:639 start_codon:yes stop_codon:yes gene_type:complete
MARKGGVGVVFKGFKFGANGKKNLKHLTRARRAPREGAALRMDELAELIIQKMSEGDGFSKTVALCSWWRSHKRVNILVQPAIKQGMLSYNLHWNIWVEPAYCSVWDQLKNGQIEKLPKWSPLCNFKTLEQVANYLFAMSKHGEIPTFHKVVHSLVIGQWTNDLFRQTGPRCDSADEVFTWLRLMQDMRPLVTLPESVLQANGQSSLDFLPA